jgi:hypothetical protein
VSKIKYQVMLGDKFCGPASVSKMSAIRSAADRTLWRHRQDCKAHGCDLCEGNPSNSEVIKRLSPTLRKIEEVDICDLVWSINTLKILEMIGLNHAGVEIADADLMVLSIKMAIKQNVTVVGNYRTLEEEAIK